MEETSTLFDQRSLSLLTYTQQSLTLVIRGCRSFCRGIFLQACTHHHAIPRSYFFTYLCSHAYFPPRYTRSTKSRYDIMILYIINWFISTITIIYFSLSLLTFKIILPLLTLVYLFFILLLQFAIFFQYSRKTSVFSCLLVDVRWLTNLSNVAEYFSIVTKLFSILFINDSRKACSIFSQIWILRR